MAGLAETSAPMGYLNEGKISVDEHEIPNDWPGHCFGCSRNNPHGLQLRFWFSEEGCFTRCVIPDHLCGIDGVVHGGIVATLLDEVAGWTILTQLGKLGITGKFTIRYLKPVPTQTELLVEGQILKQSRNVVVVRSTVHSADDELLAEGESTWFLPELARLEAMTGLDETTLQQILAKASQR